MGREATCGITVNARRFKGRAQLEGDALVIRGEVRLTVPLSSVKTARAADGVLHVRHAAGTVALELGDAARTWAEKVLHPPTLVDKLGIRPTHHVSIVNLDEPALVNRLDGRAASITSGRLRPASDVIIFGVSTERDLARLEWLRRGLVPDGAIWVVRPKGKDGVSEQAVMAAGKAAGLVDVKVARFSDTHTAEKFVIPVARR